MPQRNNRLFELVLVIGVIACGAYFFFTPTPTPNQAASPKPQVADTAVPYFPERAPAFELSTLDGTKIRYDGRKAVLFNVTAVWCQGCRERVPRDKQLVPLARAKGIEVYNILVYADQASGASFAQEFSPQASKILVDPGGKVFVEQYRGSDENCWMLVGKDGEFLYRGKEDLPRMVAALDRLS